MDVLADFLMSDEFKKEAVGMSGREVLKSDFLSSTDGDGKGHEGEFVDLVNSVVFHPSHGFSTNLLGA